MQVIQNLIAEGWGMVQSGKADIAIVIALVSAFYTWRNYSFSANTKKRELRMSVREAAIGLSESLDALDSEMSRSRSERTYSTVRRKKRTSRGQEPAEEGRFRGVLERQEQIEIDYQILTNNSQELISKTKNRNSFRVLENTKIDLAATQLEIERLKKRIGRSIEGFEKNRIP